MKPSGAMIAEQASAVAQSNITAIDILLEPDATMIQRAHDANAQLLKNFPKGFALGGEHAPHVTVLQRAGLDHDPTKTYGLLRNVVSV
jgi:hypothetical protein